MGIDLTFKQACDFIKKDQPNLINTVDNLLGITLICSSLIVAPATVAAIIPMIAVKNELIKISKNAFSLLTNKKDNAYQTRFQRMHAAYTLISYTAFFEAMDRQIPERIRKKIRLLAEEKEYFSKKAQEELLCNKGSILDPLITPDETNPLASLAVSLPHPTETLAQLKQRHTKLWRQMSQGFQDFIQKLAFWENATESEQRMLTEAISNIPKIANECFESQYFELSRKYEDFAIWANLHEHKKIKEFIESFSEYFRQYITIIKSANTNIDIGFTRLHDVVINMPRALKMTQTAEIFDSLTRHNLARIDEAIAESKDESKYNTPQLSFPSISDAFVPQSFKVLRMTTNSRHLEDESTWNDIERRNDLGGFLLNYLSSPYNTETPLIILGHPGSGKSLLSKVISAQFMSKHYTVIRVPLREVDAESGVINQIEEQIRHVSGISHVDSWARLSGAFKNNPPLVILDGYDELLQASGQVFSNYLKDVQNFQRNEAEQGRPVRVIITSRITLIDKATIPQGATILRLLEFDKRKRDLWISIWNRENADYFKDAKIEEFSLPKETDLAAAKIFALAEQPLLLMMLALYDSQDNQLRKSKSFDRTILYDRLLRQFVQRERKKDRYFENLAQAERNKEIESEMKRLSVAALGMYNRRKLFILSKELNDDLEFFESKRELGIPSRISLSQAELLLGSFFFIHKSKALHKAGTPEHHEEMAAFEFLHNTFGEFLTADFILRQTLNEVLQLKALKENEIFVSKVEKHLGTADGLSRTWFASLVYTPLFSRPVVLEMMREWVEYSLKRSGLSKSDFLTLLDQIILNQIKRVLNKREMPSIIRKETAEEGFRAPFGDHPLLGHIAIYSINLIILRVVSDSKPFIFDEKQIGIYEDGARPWDRLIHLWRSWFSLDNLNGITAIIRTKRNGDSIEISANERFQITESRNRINTLLNVGISIGDNITSGLAAAVLWEKTKSSFQELEDFADRLASEKIDIEYQIEIRRLFQIETQIAKGGCGGCHSYSAKAQRLFSAAVREKKQEALEHLVFSLKRSIQQLCPQKSERRSHKSSCKLTLFSQIINPAIAMEIPFCNLEVAQVLLNMAKEINAEISENYSFYHNDNKPFRLLLEKKHEMPFSRDINLDYYEEKPEAAILGLRLLREINGRYYEDNYGDRIATINNLRSIIAPYTIQKMAENNPESLITLVQSIHEMYDDYYLDKYWDKHSQSELFEQIVDPSYVTSLMKRNAESVIALMKFLLEIGGCQFVEKQGELLSKSGILEQLVRPKYILRLYERRPEAAMALLNLVRNHNDGQFRKQIRQKFRSIFHDASFVGPLLHRNPSSLVCLVSIVRIFELNRDFDNIFDKKEYFYRNNNNYELIFNSLPFSAFSDLQWIAARSRSQLLISCIEHLRAKLNSSV